MNSVAPVHPTEVALWFFCGFIGFLVFVAVRAWYESRKADREREK